MELALDKILLTVLILFCTFVMTGSFIYFFRVKTKYRWVKLFWGLEMVVYLGILLWTLLGGSTTVEIQYLFAMLPVSALAYGIVVSFARLKEMDAIQRLEERLNGELEEWINKQLASMKKE